MDNYISSDLIRGNIDTIILRSLSEGDKYGYEILKEIESKTQGEYILKQPTLYSCLKRLEKQGYITSFWGQITLGGRRKYYRLTPEGKKYFEKVQAEWEYSRALIDKLIAKRRTTPQIDVNAEFEDNKDEPIENQKNDNVAFGIKNNENFELNAQEFDIEIHKNDQENAYSGNIEQEDTKDYAAKQTPDKVASDSNLLDTENQDQKIPEQQEKSKKQIFIVAKSKTEEDVQSDKERNLHNTITKIPIYTPLKGKPLYAKSERVLKDYQSESSAQSAYENKPDEKEFLPKVQDIPQQVSSQDDVSKTYNQPEQISFFKSSEIKSQKKHEIDDSLIGKTKINYDPNEVFFADQRSSKPAQFQTYEDLILKEKMELFKENIIKGKKASIQREPVSEPEPSQSVSSPEAQLYSLPDNTIPDFNEIVTPSFGGTYASLEEAQQVYKIEKQYKNVLGKLFDNKNQNYELKPKRPEKNEQSSQSLNNLTNNFDSNSTYNVNNIKVAPFSKNIISEYYSSDYVYYNKFKLAQSLIFSVLMFLTNIGLYFLLNVLFRLNINTGYYFTGGLVSILIALIASVAFFYKPNRKKKIFLELKKELLNKFYLWLIISAVFILVFYLADKNLFLSINNFSKALIVIILSFNILSLPIIAKIMLKFKAFSIKS
ncbi:MAG: hypothetical protein GX756_00695 [Clostridiales bacterium]|nr:hypothetical protein [Clostridiales bacterium]